MLKRKRTYMDLMDDIYSLAHWLTGSESKAADLVNRTYVNADNVTSETAVFTTFRTCYLDGLDQDEECCLPETPCFSRETPDTQLLEQIADIRLSILLSAISGLKHRAISRITGKPLNTIRTWLSMGRKSLVHSARFENLFLPEDSCIRRDLL